MTTEEELKSLGELFPERNITAFCNEPKPRKERETSPETSRLIEEVLSERPELLSVIKRDICQNYEDVQKMLTRLNKIPAEERRRHSPTQNDPIPSIGEIILGLAEFAKSEQHFELSMLDNREATNEFLRNQIESTFQKERVQLSEVVSRIRVRKMPVVTTVDGKPKEYEVSRLELEFSHTDWATVKAKADEDPVEKKKKDKIRQGIQDYLKMRFVWGTNILQDQTYQVILPEVPASLIAQARSLNLEQQLYSEKGLTRSEIDAHLAERSVISAKVEGGTYKDFFEKSHLDNVLRNNTVYITGEHGWVGDHTVMDAWVSQQMHESQKLVDQKIRKHMQKYPSKYAVSDPITEQVRQDYLIEHPNEVAYVVAITSDNMGVSPSSNKQEEINPNIVHKTYLGMRKSPTHTKGDNAPYGNAFTQAEYGWNILYKSNSIFGLLGNGETNRNILGGWSFGGGAMIECAAQTVLKIEENVQRSFKEAYMQFLEKVQNLAEKTGFSERQKTAFADMNQSINRGAKFRVSHDDSGILENTTFFAITPAIEGTCAFLEGTKRKGIHLIKAELKRILVQQGQLYKDVGVDKGPVKTVVGSIARALTAKGLLPTDGEDPMLTQEKIATTHIQNLEADKNTPAVLAQTNGLTTYEGLTDRKADALRRGVAEVVVLLGWNDKLVSTPDVLEKLDEKDIEYTGIVTNGEHHTFATLQTRAEFPYAVLADKNNTRRKEILKQWRRIGRSRLEHPRKEMYELTDNEFILRWKKFKLQRVAEAAIKQPLREIAEATSDDVILAEDVKATTVRLAGQFVG